jgi:hypothetical protein
MNNHRDSLPGGCQEIESDTYSWQLSFDYFTHRSLHFALVSLIDGILFPKSNVGEKAQPGDPGRRRPGLVG